MRIAQYGTGQSGRKQTLLAFALWSRRSIVYMTEASDRNINISVIIISDCIAPAVSLTLYDRA